MATRTQFANPLIKTYGYKAPDKARGSYTSSTNIKANGVAQAALRQEPKPSSPRGLCDRVSTFFRRIANSIVSIPSSCVSAWQSLKYYLTCCSSKDEDEDDEDLVNKIQRRAENSPYGTVIDESYESQMVEKAVEDTLMVLNDPQGKGVEEILEVYYRDNLNEPSGNSKA